MGMELYSLVVSKCRPLVFRSTILPLVAVPNLETMIFYELGLLFVLLASQN